VTQLLAHWREADESALSQLAPLVYEDLRRLAHRYMSDSCLHFSVSFFFGLVDLHFIQTKRETPIKMIIRIESFCRKCWA